MKTNEKSTLLSRLLGKLKEDSGEVVEATAVVPTDITELQAEFDAFRLKVEEEQKQLADALEVAVAAVAAADTEVASAKARVEELEAQLALIEAQHAEKLAASRLKKIEAVVGSAKAPALMAATSKLEDAEFEAVVNAMAAASDIEANSKMFSEVGATATVDASKAEEIESQEMKILRNKYQKA